MPASLIAIPYTILEISTFLGQLSVDDDDDEKCQLNASIASLRSELGIHLVQMTSLRECLAWFLDLCRCLVCDCLNWIAVKNWVGGWVGGTGEGEGGGDVRQCKSMCSMQPYVNGTKPELSPLN